MQADHVDELSAQWRCKHMTRGTAASGSRAQLNTDRNAKVSPKFCEGPIQRLSNRMIAAPAVEALQTRRENAQVGGPSPVAKDRRT
jgi:hypothetical protein